MGIPSANIKSILGGQSLPVTLYALFYSLHAFALAYGLNIWLIRISYGLFYAMTFWFFFKVLLVNNKSAFLRSLVLMLLLVIVYGVIAAISDDNFWTSQSHLQRITFIQVHLESILPIFVFYYFGKNEMLKPSWFSVMFIVFCFDAYFMYKYNSRLLFNTLKNAEEGFTNNTGYAWAALLPLVAMLDYKKIFQYISIGVIVFFVLICVKRGALFITLIGVLYFFYQSMKTNKKSARLGVIFLVIALSVAVYYLFSLLAESNDFFIMRYEETLQGNTSGRDYIYSFFWNYFFGSENGVHVLIGNGAFATYKIYGMEAHNDWLEYAIDMGLLGVIVYAILWLRVGENYFYYAKNGNNQQVLIAMGLVIIMNLVRSFISMSLDNLYFFSSATLGYTMAIADSLRKGIQIKDI